MLQILVRGVFEGIFEIPVFNVNENSKFQLVEVFKKKYVNISGLSKKLIEIKRYGRKSINPIKDIFGVSTETMAILLEELGLVEF
jgi:hypothetical protein